MSKILTYAIIFFIILGAMGQKKGTHFSLSPHTVIGLFYAQTHLLDGKGTIDLENNKIIQWLYRHLSITNAHHDGKFWIYKKKIVFTPLFPVLILIEVSDLIFAIDSIPAIFAVSKNPFIVYTSNVFAILGLRALYFALVDIIHRFIYLKHGLSLILILIGIKMILNGIFGEDFIPTHYALMVTAVLLIGSIIVSLIKSRRLLSVKERREVLTGWVPGSGVRKRGKRKREI